MHNRREFLKDLATTSSGIFFVSCGIGKAAGWAMQVGASGRRREVVVNGRRMLTVDVHAHCYIHDTWELIKDTDVGRRLSAFPDSPRGRDLNFANLDERLRKMDEQGIDMQAVSLGSSYLHYWADRDLSRQIHQLQNEKIAELCATHPDRFVGTGPHARDRHARRDHRDHRDHPDRFGRVRGHPGRPGRHDHLARRDRSGPVLPGPAACDLAARPPARCARSSHKPRPLRTH